VRSLDREGMTLEKIREKEYLSLKGIVFIRNSEVLDDISFTFPRFTCDVV
jgi:hypothetical protein